MYHLSKYVFMTYTDITFFSFYEKSSNSAAKTMRKTPYELFLKLT